MSVSVGRHGSFKRPVRDASSECSRRNADLIRPFSHTQCSAVERDEFGDVSIVGLLESSRPSTVIRRVGSVSVRKAVERFSVWARTHVSEEGIERMRPSVTNRNASSTIDRATHVCAALFHAAPRCVFSAVFHAVAKITSGASVVWSAHTLDVLFSAQTATTFRPAISKRRAVNICLPPTRASASPFRPSDTSQNSPSSKRSSCQIYELAHVANILPQGAAHVRWNRSII